MADPLLNELLTDEDDEMFIDYCRTFYQNVRRVQDLQVRQQTLAVLRQTVLSTRGIRRVIVQHINQHPYRAAVRVTYNRMIQEALTMANNQPMHAFRLFDRDLLQSSVLDGGLPQVLRVEIDHLYRHFQLPLIVRQLVVLDTMVQNGRYNAMAAQIRERRAQETFLATYIGVIPTVRHDMMEIRGHLSIQHQIDALLDMGIHVYNIIRLRGMMRVHFPAVVLPNMDNDTLLSQQRELQQILIYHGLQRYVAQHPEIQPWAGMTQNTNNVIQDRIENDVDNYPRFRIMNWQRYIEETLVDVYTDLRNEEQGGSPKAG